ncbi:MFS transporter [Pseudactinotalea suaedae]|uniref:MFS transporter n=1 Tax=Pseudactinotalea suaedae TaxID=1524924 RepID=UPI0012E2A8C2|nr:MFS transporter [Pseudactinotalea suaedae]
MTALSGRGRVTTIALVVVCQSLQALSVGGIALFLPLIRSDIGLSFTQAGMISAVALITFAAMQIPAGAIADRFGPKRVYTIGLLGVLVLTCAFSVLDSYALILVNQGLAGIFRSLVFVPGMLLITHEFPTERRATAMGLYVAGGFSSNIALSTIGPFLVEPLGWRLLFVIFGAMGLLVVAGYHWLGGPGPAPRGAASLSVRHLGVMLREPVALGAGWLQFVRFGVANGITYWLPTFLVADHRLSLQQAGIVVAGASLLTAPANMLGGYISDRLRAPLAMIATSLAVLTVSLAAIAWAQDSVLLFLSVGVMSVFVQVYFGPLFALPTRFLGAETAPLSNGYSNLVANIGGLLAAWALGASRDVTGSFSYGLTGLAVLALSGLAVALVMRRRYPDPRSVPRVPVDA